MAGRKSDKTYHDRTASFDFMTETGNELSIVHNQKLVDEIVEDRLMLELLMSALDKLTQDERFIIDELYFNNKTEREVAKDVNLSKTGIHKKKENILKKLQEFFK
jgi:RNA polymerase sigma factor (sigma-70 family)